MTTTTHRCLHPNFYHYIQKKDASAAVRKSIAGSCRDGLSGRPAGRRPVARARRRPRLHETPRGSRVRPSSRSATAIGLTPVEARAEASGTARAGNRRRTPAPRAGGERARAGTRRDGARRGKVACSFWLGWVREREWWWRWRARARASFVWEDERTRARVDGTGRRDNIDRSMRVYTTLVCALRCVCDDGARARRGAGARGRGGVRRRAREANPPRRR